MKVACFYLRKLVSKIFQKVLTNNYSNDKINLYLEIIYKE